jgi:hypothetical protein
MDKTAYCLTHRLTTWAAPIDDRFTTWPVDRLGTRDVTIER